MGWRALIAWLETLALLGFVSLLLLAIAALLGSLFGALSLAWFVAWAGAALVLNLSIYYLSDRIVLSSYGVEIVTPEKAPNLHRVVGEVAERAGLPKPRVGIIDSESANAFATGRNPRAAVVACTKGLLRLLSEDELRGVVAHELSHVRNRDTLVKTCVATVGSFFAYAVPIAVLSAAGKRRLPLLRTLALSVLAYTGGSIGATIVKSFVSRSREYKADADGARLLGDALGLHAALPKIDEALRGNPMTVANEASSHLFIVSPLVEEGLQRFFATHPPVAKRLERLAVLSVTIGVADTTTAPSL